MASSVVTTNIQRRALRHHAKTLSQQSSRLQLRSYGTHEEVLSPSLLQQLETLAERHAAVNQQLENPNISVSALTSLSKEAAELTPVVEALTSFKDVQAALHAASAVCQDDSEDAGTLFRLV